MCVCVTDFECMMSVVKQVVRDLSFTESNDGFYDRSKRNSRTI